MNDRAREALSYARQALKNGELAEARVWAERAAKLAPQSEDPWLVLAAVGSPRESVEYLRKALELNPTSPRAIKGMGWAAKRLEQTPEAEVSPQRQEQSKVTNEALTQSPEKNVSEKNPKKRNLLLPILLIATGCAVLLFAAWSAVNSPVMASILNMAAPKAQQPVHLQSFAQVDIAKPVAVNAPAISQPGIQGIEPTSTFIPPITVVPMNTQGIQAVIVPENTQPVSAGIIPANTQVVSVNTPVESTPEATSEPGAVYAEIVADTPTSEYAPPTDVPYVAPSTVGDGEHWIDVDLSQQRVYAYAGDTVVNSFLVSTGVWSTPTVTGQFHVWIKLRSTDMSGPGYYLPDVPYTMYFYKGYGLHGTYWHSNFGTPMSHGCVNLATPDAEWLYNFSSVGTLVNVHY